MNLAIVGQGAIGSLFAYYWREYRPVLLVKHLPSKPTILHLLDNTSALLDANFESVLAPKNRLFDCLIITVKSYQIPLLITHLRTWLPSQTSIILVQNGMGGAEALANAFPSNPLYVGTTTDAVFKTDENIYQVTGQGRLDIGKWQDFSANYKPCKTLSSKALQSHFCTLLNKHPRLEWHNNIRIALYQKLAINAVINPLTALLNIKNGQLFKHAQQVSKLKEEINTLYQACLPSELTSCNAPLSANVLTQLIDSVIVSTANNFSSMQQDVHYGRETEIEAVLGYLLKMSIEGNLNTPLITTLYNDVKFLREKQI